MQNLWRSCWKKLLEVSCEFLLWFDDKYHANILCQCVLAVLPRRPGSEEDYRKNENEVDFILEKCSREFYNFLANFLPHSCVHYSVLQDLCERKAQTSKCKVFCFPIILRVTKI